MARPEPGRVDRYGRAVPRPRWTSTLAVVLAVVPAGAAEARPTPFGFLGATAGPPLVDGKADAEREVAAMARSGVETLRLPVYWAQLQPQSGGPLDLRRVDRVVAQAARRRIEVLPVVLATPAWARVAPADGSSPPRDPADYAAVLRALVDRYGPKGSLWRERPSLPRVAIRRWQVWNEPNNPFFWRTQPYARSYVALLRAANRAIKARDRGAQTVMAGVSTPDKTWPVLTRLYEAGAKGHFDIAAIHPYTGRPDDVVRLVELARDRLRRLGDARRTVWATEITWPASRGRVDRGYGFETDGPTQVRNMRQVLPALAAVRSRLRLGRIFWEAWITEYRSSTNAFDYSGLRRHRGSRADDRPGLAAFRSAARRMQGCRKRRSARDC